MGEKDEFGYRDASYHTSIQFSKTLPVLEWFTCWAAPVPWLVATSSARGEEDSENKVVMCYCNKIMIKVNTRSQYAFI